MVGGATLVAALLAGYLLAARTASPLRRFAATAAEVDAGDLTPRLEPSPAAAAELRTLAEAFNHMLDRLDRAFAQQRQFVSDASHELRSPLTAIRGQLEVLARSESPSAAEIRRVEAMTLTEMRRVERLVDDLLALARLDEGVGPGAARGASSAPSCAVSPTAGTRESPSSVSWPTGALRVDPDLIAQVVRNLLSNARRHAGPDGRVALSARADGRACWSRSTTTGRASRPSSASVSSIASTAASRSRDRASGRQRAGARHRPLDRRAARRPDLGRRLSAGRRPGLLSSCPASSRR